MTGLSWSSSVMIPLSVPSAIQWGPRTLLLRAPCPSRPLLDPKATPLAASSSDLDHGAGLSRSDGPPPGEVRQRNLRQVQTVLRQRHPFAHASAAPNRIPQDARESKTANAVPPRHLRWRQVVLERRLTEVLVVRLFDQKADAVLGWFGSLLRDVLRGSLLHLSPRPRGLQNFLRLTRLQRCKQRRRPFAQPFS